MANVSRRKMMALLAAAALPAVVKVPSAAAQEAAYPEKLIRVVVPYPVGGIVDIFARAVTSHLAKKWTHGVIIEPKPGASSNIGTQYVKLAKADGYTWLCSGPALMANPMLFKTADWDPVKDFVGVGIAGYAPLALVVHEKVSARTMREFLELVKSRPGKLNGGVAHGSSVHFNIEALKQAAGLDFAAINYSGAPPITVDLAGGVIDFSVLPVTLVQPHIASGRVRALAITGSERLALMPEIPTFDEAGYPGVALDSLYVFVVPRNTPAHIVKAINEGFNAALSDPHVREVLARTGGVPGKAMTPGEVDRMIQVEKEKLAALIAKAGIVAE